jgi:hypothetical protein
MTRQEMLLKAKELLEKSDEYHGENGTAYALKAQAWIALANSIDSTINPQRGSRILNDVLECANEAISLGGESQAVGSSIRDRILYG